MADEPKTEDLIALGKAVLQRVSATPASTPTPAPASTPDPMHRHVQFVGAGALLTVLSGILGPLFSKDFPPSEFLFITGALAGLCIVCYTVIVCCHMRYDSAKRIAGKTLAVLGCAGLLLSSGCALQNSSPELKQADDVRRAAILGYAKGNDLKDTEAQDAYRLEAQRHVDDLYAWDLERLDRLSGPDGKVDLAKARDFVSRISGERELNRAKIDAKLHAWQAAAAANNQNLAAFLRLDDLMTQLREAGAGSTAIMKTVQAMSAVFTPNTASPAAPVAPVILH